MTDEIRFDGRVAIVTGAGNGLGRSHALMLAERGAKVVVNDLGGDIHGDGGKSSAAADEVVEQIKADGGEAVANYESVENGEAIVQTALDAFGTVDIVVNNAGILRDTSFHKMTDKDWKLIQDVHLNGSFAVTHAAWPILRDKSWGRIIMTTSAAGLYGNFGQANYSSAKLGILGLANTLAIEGRKYNIHVNTIAPIAGSRLTETVMPADLLEKLKPEYVSPLVGWLCSERCESTSGIFEIGAGFIGQLRWQRSTGGVFNTARGLTPDQVAAGWDKVTDYGRSDHPAEINQALGSVLEAMNNPPLGGNKFIDLDAAYNSELVLESDYDENDLALYALGIGAAADPLDASERKYAYEMDGDFMAFPTYGVMPQMSAMLGAAKEGTLDLPGMNFGMDRLLHGEQFTEIKRPLPTNAHLEHRFTVKEAWDKDPHAIVTFAVSSTDDSGEEVIYNEFTAFVQGAGGWGGERGPSGDDVNVAPEREPDAVIEEQTDPNQTLLYRLSGDWNPLHADPAFAKAFGFDKPILHGLCTFGFAGRHVVKAFAANDGRYFKNIKVRFAKSVYPGDTLVTKMWKTADTTIVFETSVKERDELVLKNAAIELYAEIPADKPKSDAGGQAVADTNGGAVTAEPGAQDVVAMLSGYVGEHPELVDTVGKVYQWHVQNPDLGFVLDLKNGEGSVYEGTADHDTSIELEESDLMAMMRGEADAQKLYFGGKLKIDGDIMASQKLSFLADMDAAEVQDRLNASMTERGADQGGLPPASGSTGQPGGRAVVSMLADYVSAHPDLAGSVGKVYQWHVSDPDLDFVLDLKNDSGAVYEGTADHDTSIEIAEDNLMALMRGESDAQTMYFGGKLKIGGDIMASQKLTFLAEMDPAEVQAALAKSAAESAPASGDKPKAKPKREPAGPVLFDKLAERIKADKKAVNGVAGHVLRFNVTDPDSSWTLDCSGDTPELTENANGEAQAVVGIADKDLESLAKGNADIRDLHQRGLLRIDGDMRLAREINFIEGLV